MKKTAELKIAMTTTPDLKVAKLLAESAINEKLAACVSFTPGLESLYWWKGQIETTTEVLVLFKTETSRLEALEKMIASHHPYDTPEFVVLPVESASEKYLAWLESSLGENPAPGPPGEANSARGKPAKEKSPASGPIWESKEAVTGKFKRAAARTAIAMGLLVVGTRIANRFARPDGLGLPGGKLSPCPDTPGCVCSEGPSGPHFVGPLQFTGPPGEAVAKLKMAALGMRRAKLVEEGGGYLHAEFRSALFDFVDDVEFAVQPEAGRIQVRSASRVGGSDLGVNRRRVEEIRRRFQALNP